MKCENCNKEIPFITGFKQISPFRLRCPACRTRYRVKTPYMKIIFAGVILLYILFMFLIFWQVRPLGQYFFFGSIGIMVLLSFLLEVLIIRYIRKQGVLIVMPVQSKDHSKDQPKDEPGLIKEG
jgi:CXXC-20-CXXC protein